MRSAIDASETEEESKSMPREAEHVSTCWAEKAVACCEAGGNDDAAGDSMPGGVEHSFERCSTVCAVDAAVVELLALPMPGMLMVSS